MGTAASASHVAGHEWPRLAYQTALTFLEKADNCSRALHPLSGLPEPLKAAEAF